VVQVGGKGEEAFRGKPVGDVLDVVDQSPILLDDEQAVATR